MTKNSKHWKTMMARDIDRKVASEGRDPLEEGLEGLSWFETKKRNVKRRWEKTRETFGEEVGNSITSGVLCLYELFMLPFAAVLAYDRIRFHDSRIPRIALHDHISLPEARNSA